MFSPSRFPRPAQSGRFLWCSVSDAFDPGNLSLGNIGINSVTKTELLSYGFKIVDATFSSEGQEFENLATGNRHPTLIAVREWYDAAIYSTVSERSVPKDWNCPTLGLISPAT